MKSIVFAFLFFSTLSFAQMDAKSQYKVFATEFEAYSANPEVASENSTLKPGPCGQGEKEIINTPPARKLCFDLNRFDKTKNKELSADWEYEIKPVGDKYYTIRATKKGSEGAQEMYYYERKK
jgi:hypothetical protein